MWTSHRHDSGLYSGPEILLVKDGFSWPALIVPLVWALWHRMWFTTLLLVVASLVLGAAMELAGLSSAAQLALTLGASIYVGLNANDWRRASLRRRGWDDGPSVVAISRDAAELRLFQAEGNLVLR